MKMMKKALAVLLAFIMAFSYGAVASAEETTQAVEEVAAQQEPEVVAQANYELTDTFKHVNLDGDTIAVLNFSENCNRHGSNLRVKVTQGDDVFECPDAVRLYTVCPQIYVRIPDEVAVERPYTVVVEEGGWKNKSGAKDEVISIPGDALVDMEFGFNCTAKQSVYSIEKAIEKSQMSWALTDKNRINEMLGVSENVGIVVTDNGTDVTTGKWEIQEDGHHTITVTVYVTGSENPNANIKFSTSMRFDVVTRVAGFGRNVFYTMVNAIMAPLCMVWGIMIIAFKPKQGRDLIRDSSDAMNAFFVSLFFSTPSYTFYSDRVY